MLHPLGKPSRLLPPPRPAARITPPPLPRAYYVRARLFRSFNRGRSTDEDTCATALNSEPSEFIKCSTVNATCTRYPAPSYNGRTSLARETSGGRTTCGYKSGIRKKNSFFLAAVDVLSEDGKNETITGGYQRLSRSEGFVRINIHQTLHLREEDTPSPSSRWHSEDLVSVSRWKYYFNVSLHLLHLAFIVVHPTRVSASVQRTLMGKIIFFFRAHLVASQETCNVRDRRASSCWKTRSASAPQSDFVTWAAAHHVGASRQLLRFPVSRVLGHG